MPPSIARAPSLRRHCYNAKAWGYELATDYWAVFGGAALTPATADGSWATTGGANWGGGATDHAGDFLASADIGSPPGIILSDAGDLIKSVAMFGDYRAGRIFQAIMGYFPTKMITEFQAAFSTASNDEPDTAIGLFEDNATGLVTAGQMAAVYSDGTNFVLASGAAEDAGAAVDTATHVFRIVTTFGGTHEWFIDGVSQGTLAIQADEWPAQFGAGIKAATGANDILLNWVHIWYE